MKQIKIAFLGLLEGYGSVDELWIYRILKKHYDILLMDKPEEADYLICGVFTVPYSYCGYDNKIIIFFTGENYIPDLNFVDYSISPYPISLYDRCYRLPVFIDQFGHCQQLKAKNRDYSLDILNQKKYFANFISSHESEDGLRGDFFNELSKYKRVESPGSYLNNMDGFNVAWTDAGKTNFQKQCKFTLCFESTVHKGFITEKITDAFFADTIPVYCGSPDIVEFFNEKAFIYCRGRQDFDRVIKKIIELDTDDEKYIEMLRQPIFNNADCVDEILDGFEHYIRNIFDQSLINAYRRSRVYAPKTHESYLVSLKQKTEKTNEDICHSSILKKLGRSVKRLIVKTYNTIKKGSFL